MLRRAVGDDVRFEVSEVEIARGGLSYTVDTLESLAAERPGAELFLIIGMDALATFHRWKSSERIQELAELAVLARGDEGEETAEGLVVGVTRVNTRRVDVASSEIRRRLREGKPIRGFVAESVERYISAENLYRTARTD